MWSYCFPLSKCFSWPEDNYMKTTRTVIQIRASRVCQMYGRLIRQCVFTCFSLSACCCVKLYACSGPLSWKYVCVGGLVTDMLSVGLQKDSSTSPGELGAGLPVSFSGKANVPLIHFLIGSCSWSTTLPVFHFFFSVLLLLKFFFFFKSVHLPLLSSSLSLLLHLHRRVLCGSPGNTSRPMCVVFISNWIARSSLSCKLELGRPAGDVVHTVNDKNSVKHWQALLQSHDSLICGQDKGAGLCLCSSLRQQRQSDERGKQPIMSHSCYFSFCRPSSFLSFLFFFLHLHQLCSVSFCTSLVLSSLHVNKYTLPKYPIGVVLCKCDSSLLCSALLMGTSRQLSLMRTTLTSQHPLSTPANYKSHPALTGGSVAPSTASQPPTSHPPFLGAV